MKHIQVFNILLFLFSILSLSQSCADDTGSYFDNSTNNNLGNIDSTSPWGVAVVSTDYLSTSISIIDFEQQKLFREGIITSGSTDAGLSIALSGDIVLPTSSNPENILVLIDRYPNSVLTFVDPSDFSVMGQLSVATGFASNPQDFIWLDEHKAYVTRYETNPTPGKMEFDQGRDILVIDPTNRKVLSSIVVDEIEQDIFPRPTHMVYAQNLVWIAIDQLSKDFTEAGNGRVLAIDPKTDNIVNDITIDKYKNCTGITYAKKYKKLIISCSGLFHNNMNEKLGESALVSVDLNSKDFTVETIIESAERPFGFEVEMFKDDYVLCTHFGDLEKEINDTLVAVNLTTNNETIIHQVGTPYGMGGMLSDNTNDTLYVGEADAVSPTIYIYSFKDGEFSSSGEIVPCPKSGLPPRHIKFY